MFLILSGIPDHSVGWETAGQACEYLQALLTEPFFEPLDGPGWLQVVLIGASVELLVACQHVFAECFVFFLVCVPVVGGQVVFLFVCASLKI